MGCARRRGGGVVTVYLASLDSITDGLGTLSIDLTPNTKRCAKNFLHCAFKFFRERLMPHSSCDLDYLFEADRLVVLDILLLFAVAGRLLQGSDDQRRRSGNDGNLRLTVLDSELHCNTQAFLQ